MNDPRTHPVPGAEVEVLGKNKSSRRVVLAVYQNKTLLYQDLRTMAKRATTFEAWRKWAFNGRVVAKGQE